MHPFTRIHAQIEGKKLGLRLGVGWWPVGPHLPPQLPLSTPISEHVIHAY